MADFRLSKWYFDCITPEGHTSIAYTGVVEFGPLRLHYSSVLESAGGEPTTRSTLRQQPQPLVESSSVQWHSDSLDFDGEWDRGAVDLREIVFESGAGSIEWHCLVPSGPARAGQFRGHGYAEHLTMTIAPWKLPIHTLRWGRFSTVSDWIVWIDWRGEFERRLVYRNDGSTRVSRLDDELVEFEDGARLILDRSLILRDGPLGTTALAAIPRVQDTFPARLLGARERKWRSRARLERPGKMVIEDWAIHETVEWPK